MGGHKTGLEANYLRVHKRRRMPACVAAVNWQLRYSSEKNSNWSLREHSGSGRSAVSQSFQSILLLLSSIFPVSILEATLIQIQERESYSSPAKPFPYQPHHTGHQCNSTQNPTQPATQHAQPSISSRIDTRIFRAWHGMGLFQPRISRKDLGTPVQSEHIAIAPRSSGININIREVIPIYIYIYIPTQNIPLRWRILLVFRPGLVGARMLVGSSASWRTWGVWLFVCFWWLVMLMMLGVGASGCMVDDDDEGARNHW